MQKVSIFLLIVSINTILLNASDKDMLNWGYTNHKGPTYWGDLKAEYHLCKDGKNQAPINITNPIEAKLNDLFQHYPHSAIEVENNGHTIVVNFPNGNELKIDKRSFELKGFHFHTPSENQIDAKNFPMEIHLVHVSKDNELAVVAVMIKDGKNSATLDKIIKNMPKKVGDKNSLKNYKLNALDILPERKDYYRFNGSLTTPPCSEGVRWFVLKDPIEASKEQLVTFNNIIGNNNRPIQPLNARKILEID